MKQHTSNGKYTGIEIINKLMEFISLTPNPDDWFLDKLKENNPPRYMLLQQILALMDAFEIEQSKMEEAKGEQKRLLQFIAGSFARIEKPEDSPTFISILKKYVNENGSQFHRRQFHRCINMTNDMSELFSKLLAYKRQVYELLDFNGGCYEASGLFYFAIRLTNASARSIDTRDIDDVLECIVNPNALSFTEAELIANYQFPSEEKYLDTCLDWI